MKTTLVKLGLVEERRYPPAQGYASSKDDLYEFDPRDSKRVPITLDSTSFQLPALESAAHSLLLKVSVRPAVLGRLVTAWIEFCREGGEPMRHYFDKGAGGMRYLDVSGLVIGEERKPATVRIEMRGTSIDPDAELLVFCNEPVGRRRVLVLGPHPDDAEIAAFGLYKNCEAAVVTITAGDAGRPYYRHIYPDREEQHELKRRLRVWDSLAIPFWGDVRPENIANLGYFDGTLQPMRDAPEQPMRSRSTGHSTLDGQRRAFGGKLLRDGATPTWRSLVADLAHVLDVFAPAVIVTPHPLLDAHSDHRFTSFALFEALRDAGARDIELFFYLNHSPYCPLWPFGPPGGSSSLPPWPNAPARVRRFYSHPLTRADRVDKLFALEGMHDLRRPPPSITRSNEWGLLSSVWEARDAVLRHRMGSYSFYRRGIRSREMFFVHPAQDAVELLDSYIEAPRLW